MLFVVAKLGYAVMASAPQFIAASVGNLNMHLISERGSDHRGKWSEDILAGNGSQYPLHYYQKTY
jgi:hypothetical protein